MPQTDPERIAVVIEDDPDVSELLEALLIDSGFAVHCAFTGGDGIDLVNRFAPLITTLDVNMPGLDGFETLRRIRTTSDTRILMISARTEEIDVVQGLSMGADDFIAKPFRSREVRARIETILRRSAEFVPTTPPSAPAPPTPNAALSAAPTGDGWLGVGEVFVHVEKRHAQFQSERLPLTRSEFDLLATLCAANGRVCSKADLVLQMRGQAYLTTGLLDTDKRSLEVHVANLRRKLEQASMRATERPVIETVRSVGYRLSTAPTTSLPMLAHL
ncbi:hypothetical protein JF66_17340 [Cryobacterium sp. MLB-32]|uniref:response regulator transcription factor n=1 Tax=Cryobacterium sp. MLB-32 TaxID=1529318 RepID=UPI0004E6E7E1|nr:response regulator transcription factor [Cryobacterium sp. MLB-32]KFF58608.1 hypothetical protein JF66_17340 [Cryobacterium sp. MLB-32]